ncbi:hypothetical protein EW146_g7286 [Bondarzewia mesenterica]|uniref:3'-5' exonuclease domain-containing protein n=1 Tax=Bondarzewia mesenterica TaxID=1095465 RepID=A0A4S4LN43_9AGAM|nr:hypothetical protein EW146_g7286 [Bondarzewia mesenterica]
MSRNPPQSSTSENPIFQWSSFFPDAQMLYIQDAERANLEVSRLQSLHPDITVGFDLEWKPNYRRGELERPAALIQIGCESVVLLIQVSAMKAFPEKLRQFLECPRKFKVGVGIQHDCRKLYRDFKISVRSCIDLSLLARSVDSRWKGPYKNPIGLARLTETYLDRALPKGKVTRSNWEATLSAIQLDYAANDCHSSLLVYHKLMARAVVTEPPPEIDFYSFDMINGVLRDPFNRPWYPINPFYDPGPPPPRPEPQKKDTRNPPLSTMIVRKFRDGTQDFSAAQCDTVHLSWERGQASGPNPTAPYYLQIYTSTFIVPFVVEAGSGTSFDFAVPFYPGTQYQICMFGSNGATGGCQGMYTVIANTSSSNSPSCTNVTFPAGAMNVDAAVSTGAFSQYGWIDQVAPTLHPPLNITSNSMDTIKWTVSLSWGYQFFISLVDSEGNKWSQGPLHSGGNGPTSCLDLDSSGSSVSPSIAIGSGIGGLVLGLILGAVAALLFYRRRTRRRGFSTYAHPSTSSNILNTRYDDEPISTSSALDPDPHSHLSAPSTQDATGGSRRTATSGTVSSLGRVSNYHIEPFVLPSEDPASHARSSSIHDPSSPLLAANHVPPASAADTHLPQPSGSHVYVVHHDGGRPPVTVYTENGTEVVELPPRYVDDRGTAIQTPRQPVAVPRKQRRVRS